MCWGDTCKTNKSPQRHWLDGHGPRGIENNSHLAMIEAAFPISNGARHAHHSRGQDHLPTLHRPVQTHAATLCPAGNARTVHMPDAWGTINRAENA